MWEMWVRRAGGKVRLVGKRRVMEEGAKGSWRMMARVEGEVEGWGVMRREVVGGLDVGEVVGELGEEVGELSSEGEKGLFGSCVGEDGMAKSLFGVESVKGLR